MNRVSSLVAAAANLLLLGSAAVAHAADPQSVSDEQITNQVVAALHRADPDLVQHLEVSTKNGVVTLSGHARSIQAVTKAIQAARRVPGVSKVEDHLSLTM